MKHAHETEQRLTDLEIKTSFHEDSLDQLNQIIVRQQQQIELIMREIGHLRQSGVDGGIGPLGNPRDEMPPHY